MILYPSLHLKNGAVARLTRSSSDQQQAELLDPNPVARATSFEAEGFPWLHIVDLDGAFADSGVNAEVIQQMRRQVKIPMQLSGGLHDLAAIDCWLAHGIDRVVLTSAALDNPALLRQASAKYPGRIVVKIDALDGFVTRTGWSNKTAIKALDFALRVEDAGAAGIIYADINLDGALSEVNMEAITDLAFALTIPVTASGGVHSLQDLAELKSHAYAGVEGLILGRALYNGTINAREALALALA